MTLSFWQKVSREPDIECDVALVGGGLTGCATAYWLSRLSPELRITIVESGRLASGASGRNTGFISTGTVFDYLSDLADRGPVAARRLWHFTIENRNLLFSELNGALFELESSGSLTVAGSPEEDERLQSCVAYLRADGIPTAYIPRLETNRRLVSKGYHGGLYLPSGAMLHPIRFIQQLADLSQATVLTNHAVQGLVEKHGRVTIETPIRRVFCERVVLTLNAYLPRLYPTLERYVLPVRAQMLATEPMIPRWMQLPAYSHEEYYFVRQTMNGEILIGGTRHFLLQKEDTDKDRLVPSRQIELERYLHDHFPQTKNLSITNRWSGLMGFSPDRFPIIGQVPELPGNYWAAGFSGHGMGFGFRIGKLLAELILDYPNPDDYALFTSDRFKAEQLHLNLDGPL